MKAIVKFAISSYWQSGSGLGADAVADSVVVKGEDGLPYIPGRSVKGLLREAVTLASLSGLVPRDRVVRWFGSPLAGTDAMGRHDDDDDQQERRLEDGRFASTEGALWFGSALLPEPWRAWSRSLREPAQDPIVQSLYAYMASTAIDQYGTARQHSLRVYEVAVPMDLYAAITGPSDDNVWISDLKSCAPLLRVLGARRSRGFGRVDVTVEATP